MAKSIFLFASVVVLANAFTQNASTFVSEDGEIWAPTGLLNGIQAVLSTTSHGKQFSKYLGFYPYRNHCFLRTNKRVTFEIVGIDVFRFKLKSTYKELGFGRFLGKFLRLQKDIVSMSQVGTTLVAVVTDRPNHYILRAADTGLYIGHSPDTNTLRTYTTAQAPFAVQLLDS